jgi:hypothetical protein
MKDVVASFGSLALFAACGSVPANEPANPSTPLPSDAATAPAPEAAASPANPKVSEDGSCGGLQGLACAAGQYCFYTLEATCGAADQMGKCTPIADMCTQQFDPVCGCNDKTYPNDCYAAREGISVAKKGECAK